MRNTVAGSGVAVMAALTIVVLGFSFVFGAATLMPNVPPPWSFSISA